MAEPKMPWEHGPSAETTPTISSAAPTAAVNPWDYGPEGAPAAPIENLNVTDNTLTGGVRVPNSPQRAARRNLANRHRADLNRGFFSRLDSSNRNLAQGVPVLRNFVGETPESREQAELNPIATTGARVAAGTAAMAPAAVGGMIASGPTAIANIGMQGGLGAATTLADAYTSNNPPQNAQEAMLRAAFGAATAAAPTAAARLWAPSGFRQFSRPEPLPPKPDFANMTGDDLVALFRARGTLRPDLADNMATNPRGLFPVPPPPRTPSTPQLNQIVRTENRANTAEATTPIANQIIPPLVGGLAGGAAGHWATGGDLGATLLGMSGGVLGQRVGSKMLHSPRGQNWVGRTNNPEVQAILNALGLQAFPQTVNPNTTPSNVPNFSTLTGR